MFANAFVLSQSSFPPQVNSTQRHCSRYKSSTTPNIQSSDLSSAEVFPVSKSVVCSIILYLRTISLLVVRCAFSNAELHLRLCQAEKPLEKQESYLCSLSCLTSIYAVASNNRIFGKCPSVEWRKKKQSCASPSTFISAVNQLLFQKGSERHSQKSSI